MHIIKLGEICDLDNGYAFKSSDYIENSNTINCRMSNIRPDGAFDIMHNVKYLPNYYAEKYKDYLLKNGDLIIAMTDMAGDPKILGIPTVVETQGYNLLLNQRVGRLKLLKKDIDIRYLKLALQNERIREFFKKFAGGGVQLNVGKNDILSAPIYMRNLSQQQYIGNIFDEITSIKKIRKQQLKQLDLLVESRFVEMFGDPELNSKNWNEFALREYLNVVGGYAFKSELFKEKGIPVLRIGNINSGHFQPVNMVYWEYDTALERYLLRSGDIVMSLTGTVGKNDYGNVCILGNEYDLYYLNQRNAKLELGNGINKYYLANLLKFTTIKKRLTGISRGVRQANISNKDILNLVVPIPPIELQNKFARFVEQVEKTKTQVQKSLDEAQLLFNSLMQEYFG